jgi:hypothetical protein
LAPRAARLRAARAPAAAHAPRAAARHAAPDAPPRARRCPAALAVVVLAAVVAGGFSVISIAYSVGMSKWKGAK